MSSLMEVVEAAAKLQEGEGSASPLSPLNSSGLPSPHPQPQPQRTRSSPTAITVISSEPPAPAGGGREADFGPG